MADRNSSPQPAPRPRLRPTRNAPALLLAGLAVVAQLTLAATAAATPREAPASELTLEKIRVDPPHPGPDTLCKLTVTIRNHGAKTASQFGLKVSINGDALPVYGSQLFLSPIAPDASLDLPLYNFWSTESARTPPSRGRLQVEVTLTEAQWTEIATDDDGVEVWTPLGAVDPLPPPLKIKVPID